MWRCSGITTKGTLPDSFLLTCVHRVFYEQWSTTSRAACYGDDIGYTKLHQTGMRKPGKPCQRGTMNIDHHSCRGGHAFPSRWLEVRSTLPVLFWGLDFRTWGLTKCQPPASTATRGSLRPLTHSFPGFALPLFKAVCACFGKCGNASACCCPRSYVWASRSFSCRGEMGVFCLGVPAFKGT